MFATVQNQEVNAFRDSEKYYAGKYRPFKNKRGKTKDYVDYSDVIDFSNIENNTAENKELIKPIQIHNNPSSHFRPIERAYTISSVEGICKWMNYHYLF